LTPIQVSGDTDLGFERVADEFRSGFERHGELGAAFAAYVGGNKVVDLWGGVADSRSGAAWEQDTLQLIFSGTKGLTAGVILLMLDDGLIELDRPVSDYWPEFATGGKEQLTVGDLVSHQAGLPAIRARVEQADILDGVKIASLLAAQAPHWSPNGRLAYHALTYGWLCDALVRRVYGKPIGEVFDSRIRSPLDLAVWIGLPDEMESRVSHLLADGPVLIPPSGEPDVGRLVYWNPPTFEDPMPWNRRDFHAAELPAANGVATARSMAKYYACLANGGALNGARIFSPQSVELGQRELARGTDPFFGEPLAFGVGFELQTELMTLGPCPDAFGHTGAGGSSHGAWPEAKVGFSYCMNLMRENMADHRARRLLGKLAESVGLSGGASTEAAGGIGGTAAQRLFARKQAGGRAGAEATRSGERKTSAPSA
jgi:CubicO group peptidase (beta-lactamase class C family)